MLGDTTPPAPARAGKRLDLSNRALQQAIYNITDMQAAVNALATQASASASAIAALQNSIAAYAQTAAQAQDLMNAISVAGGGADNSQAALWANVSPPARSPSRWPPSASCWAWSQSIAADTTAAQAAMAEGARAAQKAIEDANAAQIKARKELLAAAEKMVDVGRELRDYVQGLRIGNLSSLTPAEKLAPGRLGLQHHAGRPPRRRHRHGALQELPAPTWSRPAPSTRRVQRHLRPGHRRTLDSWRAPHHRRRAPGRHGHRPTHQSCRPSPRRLPRRRRPPPWPTSSARPTPPAGTAQRAGGRHPGPGRGAGGRGAQARLTEEQARAAAIATEQAAAQAALLQAQQQGRDALVSLPTVLNDNNLALIAEIARLNERIAALDPPWCRWAPPDQHRRDRGRADRHRRGRRPGHRRARGHLDAGGGVAMALSDAQFTAWLSAPAPSAPCWWRWWAHRRQRDHAVP